MCTFVLWCPETMEATVISSRWCLKEDLGLCFSIVVPRFPIRRLLESGQQGKDAIWA